MIKQLIIIALIFAILILGQQIYFKKLGAEFYKKVEGWGSGVWQKCQNYWDKNIFGKVSGEIEKRQNIAKQEIKEQTKEVTQTAWQKIKNYFVGSFNAAFSSVTTEQKQ